MKLKCNEENCFMIALPPTNDKYERKIFAFLNNMQPETEVQISSIAKKENIYKFTETVKFYMRYHRAKGTIPWDNNIELSSDYKKVKKLSSYWWEFF